MKIVACYSNKGGVGKTAASVNLAYAAAAAGQQVLLCDLDPQGAAGFHFKLGPTKHLSDAALFEGAERLARSIRPSGYDGLDILPSHDSYRDFDTLLSRMKHRRSRLKKSLRKLKGDYDLVVLDCPPSLSLLSENVFRAADALLVPVIPSTLSQRSFQQLTEFFAAHDLPLARLHACFSMVQGIKSLHGAVMAEMTAAYPEHFLETRIPFTSVIEKMGLARAPVLVFAPSSAGALAYQRLYEEFAARIA